MTDGDDGPTQQFKLYDKLVDWQQNVAAREVLREKRAVVLTRHLLGRAEEHSQALLENEREKNAKRYEEYMEKYQRRLSEEAKSKEESRTQRRRVFADMQSKDLSTAEASDRGKDPMAIQEASLQARQELEKRRKWQEDKLKERQEELRQKFAHQEDTLKSFRSQQQEQLLEVTKPQRERRLAEAEKRRERELEDRRNELLAMSNARDNSQKEAMQRRVERQMQSTTDSTFRATRREECSLNARLAMEQQAEEKRQRWLEKAEAAMWNRPVTEAQVASHLRGGRLRCGNDRQLQDVSVEPSIAQDAHVQSEKNQREATGQEPQINATPRRPSQHALCDLATTRKEYCERVKKLEDTRYHALTHKKFKALAKAGEDLEQKRGEDLATRRMRVVYDMCLTQKQEHGKKPQDHDRGSSKYSSAFSDSAWEQDALSGQGLQPCGLCQKEFLAELLVVSVARRIIERYQQSVDGCSRTPRTPRTGKTGRHAATKGMSKDACLQVESKDASSASDGSGCLQDPGPSHGSLCDANARLCATCWHAVRMRSV